MNLTNEQLDALLYFIIKYARSQELNYIENVAYIELTKLQEENAKTLSTDTKVL